MFSFKSVADSFNEFHLEISLCNSSRHASNDYASAKILDDFGRVCQRKGINQKQLRPGISRSLKCESGELHNVRKIFLRWNKNHDRFCISVAKLRIESWKEEYHIISSGNGTDGIWTGPFLLGTSKVIKGFQLATIYQLKERKRAAILPNGNDWNEM